MFIQAVNNKTSQIYGVRGTTLLAPLTLVTDGTGLDGALVGTKVDIPGIGSIGTILPLPHLPPAGGLINPVVSINLSSAYWSWSGFLNGVVDRSLLSKLGHHEPVELCTDGDSNCTSGKLVLDPTSLQPPSFLTPIHSVDALRVEFDSVLTDNVLGGRVVLTQHNRALLGMLIAVTNLSGSTVGLVFPTVGP